MNKNSLLLLPSLLFCFTQSLSQEKELTIENKMITPHEIGIFDTDLLTHEFHKERRNELRKLMPDNSMAIL